MKKLIFASVLALVGATTMNAQRIQKGEKQLNAGVILVGNMGVPVYAGFDYGVHQDVTVGGEVSYAGYTYVNAKASSFGIAFNSNYHFNTLLNVPNKWDLYAGLNLGYSSFSYSVPDGDTFNSTGALSSGVNIGAQIGARYYFTNNLGANLQFAGGSLYNAGARIGISYKL